MADPLEPESEPVAVKFDAPHGDRIDVSMRDAYAISFSGAVFMRNLCTTPCAVKVPKGRHFFVFNDPDTNAVSGGNYLLDAPSTISMRTRSRRGTRRGLILAGTGLALGSTAASVYMFAREEPGLGYLTGLGISAGISIALLALAYPDTIVTTQTP